MFGVVNQSIAALRSEPFHRSELTNQILFGETFSVIEQHKDWFRVKLSLDGYEGWVENKVCRIFDQEQLDLISLSGITSVSTRLFSAKELNHEYPIKLCPGSTLYHFDSTSGTFKLLDEQFKAFSIPIEETDSNDLRHNLVELSYGFINSPYLWGGRSPYGIDCSGLVQVLFKMIGMAIPRDASQQVHLGKTVAFVNLAKPGDLAFFDDEEGNITHVGIILPEGKIVHSSGFVRVDKLDHQGIFSTRLGSYTHNLRVIKKIIED